MTARAESGKRPGSGFGLVALLRDSVKQLWRAPSHARRAEAARRLARHGLLLAGLAGVAIVTLMYLVDAREIVLMPPRGTPGLWPIFILTDFGKAGFVLGSLAAMLFVVVLTVPQLRGNSRSRLLRLGLRIEFIFLATLCPVLVGEVLKWIIGRGRPFVGGPANAFNFVHFSGTQAYASLPSSHAITAFALAFAVSAVWPRMRVAMAIYALAIGATRLVLLAHHPSDVVAGAVVGVIGAMVVRYWFAARHLGFAIADDGAIGPQQGGAFSGALKRVAAGASSP
jgi:membrane-associated phospholipid phosphatase